ncbi:MAG: hypothetical protein QOE27_2053 [Solirubrobacteraceae bacterium]|nr:hypothetical protein [Solirubrobacteraceae bacterium]
MATPYSGPLRDGPPAVELHNTLYAAPGGLVDGLANPDQARAWIDAVARRLPIPGVPPGPDPAIEDLVALRAAVRVALRAAVDGGPQDPGVLEAINRASRRAPRSPTVESRPDAGAGRGTDFHGASRADIIIAALAGDAVDLLTGPDRLGSCRAPGCVLIFLRDHPRREWCSDACGNRARQARHYERRRRPGLG